MRLERRGDRHRLGRQAGGGAGLADGGHAGADRQLAGDEVGAARRAARLGVVVGEQHALGGDLVEVRRPARHHAAVVGADVPHADVVAHDEDDVGLRLRGGRRPARPRATAAPRATSRRPMCPVVISRHSPVIVFSLLPSTWRPVLRACEVASRQTWVARARERRAAAATDRSNTSCRSASES